MAVGKPGVAVFPVPAEGRAAKRTANEKRAERMRCFITCGTAGAGSGASCLRCPVPPSVHPRALNAGRCV